MFSTIHTLQALLLALGLNDLKMRAVSIEPQLTAGQLPCRGQAAETDVMVSGSEERL